MARGIERAARLRRNPGFRRFWAACTIFGFGSAITVLALGVIIVGVSGFRMASHHDQAPPD